MGLLSQQGTPRTSADSPHSWKGRQGGEETDHSWQGRQGGEETDDEPTEEEEGEGEGEGERAVSEAAQVLIQCHLPRPLPYP